MPSLTSQAFDLQRHRLIEKLRFSGITDRRVLAAMETVPRHLFIDESLWPDAYLDIALPVGRGQTISQPYVVARMTSALLGDEKTRLKKVLEIGTGSGYQTAVLSYIADDVYSIERIESLSKEARERFTQLGITNVHTKYGDGILGWPEHAPFDGIIVTAAPKELPPALMDQLADGGRMVIPVGGFGFQHLLLVTRQGDRIQSEQLDAVRFVPLVPGVQ